MLRNILCVAVLTAAAMLATSSTAHAWGAAHVGYTHVGPGGVQHYGRTVGYGPNGSFSTDRGYAMAYGSSRAGYGSYNRYGASSGAAYHYGSSSYGSYDRYAAYGRGW